MISSGSIAKQWREAHPTLSLERVKREFMLSGSEDHIRADPSSPSGGSDQRERGGQIYFTSTIS